MIERSPKHVLAAARIDTPTGEMLCVWGTDGRVRALEWADKDDRFQALLARYQGPDTVLEMQESARGLILCKEELARAIDKAIFPGIQGGPLMHIIAAKAICFKEALEPSFKEYATQIVRNAKAMETTFHQEGVRMVSGGTDNHLMLLDLVDTDLSGMELETLLGDANITVNKNMVPRDKRKPSQTSGVRIGTPAVTTRGMKEAEMTRIAQGIASIIRDKENALPAVREMVRDITHRFPLFD